MNANHPSMVPSGCQRAVAVALTYAGLCPSHEPGWYRAVKTRLVDRHDRHPGGVGLDALLCDGDVAVASASTDWISPVGIAENDWCARLVVTEFDAECGLAFVLLENFDSQITAPELPLRASVRCHNRGIHTLHDTRYLERVAIDARREPQHRTSSCTTG